MAVNFDFIWAKYILKLKTYLKNYNVYFKCHISILLNFVQQKKNANYIYFNYFTICNIKSFPKQIIHAPITIYVLY
jgi:hypothetical protein